MFGKMKRTTSMMGITVENHLSEPPQRDQFNGYNHMLSPRYSTSDHLGSLQAESNTVADFLRTCGLCRRRLVPGRDIYMYRGDTAFCSEECREDQMKQDEKKERRKLATQHHRSPATASATGTTTKDSNVAATLQY